MNRLVIIDDHAVVREGLKSALNNNGFDVIAAVSNLSEARSAIAALSPDGVVIDINLPDGSGYEIVAWIRKFDLKMPVVILTLNDGKDHIRAAKKAGANAFVVKSAPLSELIAALTFAFVSPHSFTAKNLAGSQIEFGLTARELNILYLVEQGQSNQQVSEELFISCSTVKTHTSSIFRKLGARNRVDAVRIAKENGLLT
jgi:DNA-binding NarL/FixJ family response regulator